MKNMLIIGDAADIQYFSLIRFYFSIEKGYFVHLTTCRLYIFMHKNKIKNDIKKTLLQYTYMIYGVNDI